MPKKEGVNKYDRMHDGHIAAPRKRVEREIMAVLKEKPLEAPALMEVMLERGYEDGKIRDVVWSLLDSGWLKVGVLMELIALDEPEEPWC